MVRRALRAWWEQTTLTTHVTLLLVGLVASLYGVALAFGQTPTQFERLEDRMDRVESLTITHSVEHLGFERRLSQLETVNLEHRLTRLEALGEGNREILLAVAPAVAILALEAVLRMMRSWRPRPAD